MSLTSLLLEALNLLFIGMLFVTSFLGLLVFIIPFLNKIVPDEPIPAQATAKPNVSNNIEQETLVAVISAAVQQYRSNHK
ncbi:MAG: OadG family protein [Gammaproteobacteria bacterium]|nr:OadG family protein [Gammaproteobacteria bacterium]